jgi:DNA-binding phage protein
MRLAQLAGIERRLVIARSMRKHGNPQLSSIAFITLAMRG